ncbi:SsgA family sporulation/cell division regulator [Streptomyces tateyamensis]|uniref:SsgA family sporulation/cell division regulator n=1 Tax=Streptomyces tateyamensis TaxID=565073 RepID=A0A2V4P165_9ACTN|nr:SsgA family sporulation/cell division regulator [Streptomyces tateyamensis]PYC88412.1 SsgA family sporulation/cell division regulator [Streptomyces tateyamensis]
MDLITARTTMQLRTGVDTVVPVTAECSYSTADPFAVRCQFPGERDSVDWVFGRDLLARGLTAGCGDGDVHIAPADRQNVYIAVAGPNGVALLVASVSDLVDFLTRSYALVPKGTEGAHIDWDACIDRLLASPS